MRGGEEPKVLDHQEWPGYRVAFYWVMGLSSLYLAVILALTMGGHP